MAVVGCLLAGVPVVPVPPDSGPRERAHLLRDSGAAVWLGAARADVALERCRSTSRERGRRRAGRAGRRHGVGHVHLGHDGRAEGRGALARAVAAGLDGLGDAWAWTPDDVLVHGLPLFHVHGLVLGVLGALRAGSRLVHTGRPTPAGLRGGGRHAVLRRADGVGPRRRRPRSGARAAPRPAAGLRQRRAAGTGVPRPAGAGRAGPVERYGMTETLITARGAGRRRAPAGLGRRAASPGSRPGSWTTPRARAGRRRRPPARARGDAVRRLPQPGRPP